MVQPETILARDWDYQLARNFYGAVELDGAEWMVIPEGKPGAGLIIKASTKPSPASASPTTSPAS